MKFLIIISALSVACICSCTATSEEQKIEQLLKDNAKELTDIRVLLNHIDATDGKIKDQLEQQRVWLPAINRIDELIGKLNQFLEAQSVVVLEALTNVTLKAGQNSERLSKELAALAHLQYATKQNVNGLEVQLEIYQKQMIGNARIIENNILDLTKLVTRAVLPKLNGLQCSYDSLETSQINIEVELKSLARLKDINDDSNGKLYLLGEQLSSLNRSQEARLSALTADIEKLNPLNSWQIENSLRELIISQKRIEYDIDACSQSALPVYPVPEYPQSYELNPPTSQPRIQEVQLAPVWSVKEPKQPGMLRATCSQLLLTIIPFSFVIYLAGEQSGPYYASAYAKAPQTKPKASYSSRSNSAKSVSWQQPLPWEAATSYRSAPAPSKPHDSASKRKKPASSPTPCPQAQYAPKSSRHSAPPAYGPPPSPPQSY
ncbi:hypothetical protein KR222_004807, partial [Zaprionus bogoriensis]